MATHSSILAWEIPRTEEPQGLQSVESPVVRHDLVTRQQQIVHLQAERVGFVKLGIGVSLPYKAVSFYRTAK